MIRLLVLLLLPLSVSAQTLPEDDNAPLTGGFGLPGIEEGGDILDRWEFRGGFSFLTASHAIVEDSGNESLILDGESMRVSIDATVGIGNGIEIGAEIPWVAHQSGGLDSLIDTWHDIFGLPDGSRNERPQDVLEFAYTDNGVDRLDFTQSASGLGDIRLFAGFDIDSSDTHRRAFRVSVKLPTGDADKLLGSGGYDMSIGLAGDVSGLGGRDRWDAFYRASLTHIGEPDLLATRYEDYIGQVSGGVQFRLNERVTFNAQTTLRSAVYESEIEKLGEVSWTLTFGGTIRLTPVTVLTLGVGEDIKVNSAPDVSFNIGLRYRPQ